MRCGGSGNGTRSGRSGRVPLLPLLPFLSFASACELTEVVVPPGEPTVVVQAVLSRTRNTQFVLVERSLTGAEQVDDRGELVPPDEPGLPIVGALVTLTHEGPSPCATPTVQLRSRPDRRGIYETMSLCPLEPNDEVSLRVVAPGGTVVTGRTRIPGVGSIVVRLGNRAAVEGGQVELHRERDTLRISAEPIVARAMQVEVRRWDRADDLDLLVFTDSLGLALAGNLVNPFEGDSGESVFRAGRRYILTVALTDSNYFDFVRSRSDPFTGRGFINHLTGGIGVFGSLDARGYVLRVTAPVDDPREGLYRLRGEAGELTTELEVELYLDDLEAGVFSAFLRGTWFGEAVQRSLDGRFGQVEEDENSFVARFELPGGADGLPIIYVLRGTRASGGAPFPVSVVGANLPGPETFEANLTATQLSGPASP